MKKVNPFEKFEKWRAMAAAVEARIPKEVGDNELTVRRWAEYKNISVREARHDIARLKRSGVLVPVGDRYENGYLVVAYRHVEAGKKKRG